MEEKSIDELSIEEILEQLELRKSEGREYNWNQLIIKLFELTKKLSNQNFNKTILYTKYSKQILQNFGQIFKIDSQKAIELLKTVSSKELQEKAISKRFGEIFEIDSQKAIELLKTISSKELQEKAISKRFRQIFQKDSQKAIELLKTISSKELQDKTISESFGRIFKKDSEKAIELINSISSEELQDKTILEDFGKIFEIDSQKAFYNSEKIISILDNEYIKMKNINQYMNFALKNSIVPNIDLIKEIVNKDLKNRIIETFFNNFIRINRALSIRLLAEISDGRLRDKIIDNYQSKYNSIDTKLHIFHSKNIVKKRLIPLKIKELENIQKNIDSQNKSDAIYKAHREIQKKDNSTLELDKLTVSRLSFLIIHEKEESNFNRLLNEFSKRVKKEGKNYSEIIFETIRDSKISNNTLLKLEKYIDKKEVKNRLRKLKEDRASQKSLNEILEKLNESRKKRDRDKEKYFLYLFRKKHDVKNISAIIPQIATKDFKLAKRLLNRVKDKRQKEKVQKEMFLNLYKNLEQMMYVYRRIEDFYTKEKLSKIALAHHLPNFINSFFHKSLSALDSQNIINTLDKLSTIAPREVLKYYGEIEDDIGDRVDEVIEEIKELKSEREEARSLKDMELLKDIKIKIQRLKDDIQKDKELFEAFLIKFDIDEFEFEDRTLFDVA